MSFNKNLNFTGKHAFLSPSNYHWLDYDEDKMTRYYFEKQQARRGDELHAYAQRAIELGIRQADNGTTLSTYINDAIGFRMQAEVPLVYDETCFGTADACGFRDSTLRIHDLKTGKILASMKQLLIYAGLFCYEYRFAPDQIRIILRIYQNDDIVEMEPDPMEMLLIMDRIATQAKLITYLREED